MDPTYPLVPTMNFLGMILALIPLPWLFRSLNIGAFMFSVWAILGCLSNFVNTVVWRNNYNDSAPVWCDISSYFSTPITVGVPACSLAITRRLFKITRLKPSLQSRSRIDLWIDSVICIVFPLFTMFLYYCNQSARYAVLEELGCSSVGTFSVLGELLTDLWPALLSAISALIYCPLILVSLWRRRKDVQNFQSNDSLMSRDNYNRLMALGCLDAFINLPIGILFLAYDFASQKDIPFYPGWNVIHSTISEILQVPTEGWDVSTLNRFGFYIQLVLPVVWAFIFFAFFGLTRDMRERYKSLFWKSLNPLGLTVKVSRPKVESNIIFGSGPGSRRPRQGHTISITSDADDASSGDRDELSNAPLDLESQEPPIMTVQDEFHPHEKRLDEKIVVVEGSEFA